MNTIYFNNDEEALSKLKELKVVSKTKKNDVLKKIKYKEIINNEIFEYKCNVIGYNIKTTNINCLSKIYENLIVDVNGDVFNINIDHLISMQKKDFGNENQLTE